MAFMASSKRTSRTEPADPTAGNVSASQQGNCEVSDVVNEGAAGQGSPNQDDFQVVSPVPAVAVEPQSLAPRAESLDGLTIAFVWDYMFRGEELFPAMAQELTARFPKLQTVGWAEFGNTHGPDEASVLAALPAKLKQHGVDAVISAVGC